MNTSLHLSAADLERLLARFAGDRARGYRCEAGQGRLRVTAHGVRIPGHAAGFDATFDVRATLAPGMRNLVIVQLRIEKLPLGLQWIVNPMLESILRGLAGRQAAGYVEVRSSSEVRIHLEALPRIGPAFGDGLLLTGVAAPGEAGSAMSLWLEVEPPGKPVDKGIEV